MSEQITEVRGRIAQKDNAPFFIVNLADISAADVMYIDSAFGTTSLRDFLIFQNPDMTSSSYDLYVDTTYIVGTTKPEDPGDNPNNPNNPDNPDNPDNPETPSGNISAKLGIAILGSMILGTE